jgi:hypothetical protein
MMKNRKMTLKGGGDQRCHARKTGDAVSSGARATTWWCWTGGSRSTNLRPAGLAVASPALRVWHTASRLLLCSCGWSTSVFCTACIFSGSNTMQSTRQNTSECTRHTGEWIWISLQQNRHAAHRAILSKLPCTIMYAQWVHNITLRSFRMRDWYKNQMRSKFGPSLRSAEQGGWLQTLFNIQGGGKEKITGDPGDMNKQFGVNNQNSSPFSLAASARAFMRPW